MKAIWFGAAVLLVGGVAHADRTLTLDDALSLARAHNRDLRVGRARLAASEAGIAQARAALAPTVAAQGRYTHNYKQVALDFAALSPVFADMGPIIIQKGEQLDGSLTANVPLVAPSAWLGYSAAKATAQAGEANYAVTEASVLTGVAEAYFAAAGTDEVVVAREHAVKVADETFAFAKARVGSQLANPVDVTRAETALVRAQQDLVEAQNSRASAYRGLATLLGTHDEFHAAPAANTAAATGDVDHALAARPELAAERATLDAADKTSRANAYRWAPTLSAFGNAHLQNYAGFSGDKYSWAVGLQLDWTLYDGGARDAARHVADAQATEAQAHLELLHDTVSDDVANALGTLDTNRKAVDAAQRAVALANESLRLTRAQYEAGTAQQLDVLQAQDSVVTAEVGLAQAHFAVSLADVELRRATGSI
jgi:outer membrane protein TolC